MSDTERTLIVAIYHGTSQLGLVHVATSGDEADIVEEEAQSYGPVWRFPLADVDGVPLQWSADE